MKPVEDRVLTERAVNPIGHVRLVRAGRDVRLHRLPQLVRDVRMLARDGLRSEDDHHFFTRDVTRHADRVLELLAGHREIAGVRGRPLGTRSRSFTPRHEYGGRASAERRVAKDDKTRGRLSAVLSPVSSGCLLFLIASPLPPNPVPGWRSPVHRPLHTHALPNPTWSVRVRICSRMRSANSLRSTISCLRPAPRTRTAAVPSVASRPPMTAM